MEYIAFGDAVKVADDGSILPMRLVLFSTANDPDVDNEYFTAKTDYGVDLTDGKTARLPLHYSHGFNKSIGKAKIGFATVKMDDTGIWMEAELDTANKYAKRIQQLAQKGVLGASSGAVSHLTEYEKDRSGKATWIKQWPLGEASLTVKPAEPRTIMAAKEFAESDAMKDAIDDDLTADRYFSSAGSSLTMSALYSLDSMRSWGVMDALDGYTRPTMSSDQRLALALAVVDEHAVLSKQVITHIAAAFADEDAAEEVKTTIKSLWLSPEEIAADDGARAALPFAEQAMKVLAAVAGLGTRAADLSALRVKEGRQLSAANHGRLNDIADRLKDTHESMRSILKACTPPTKTDGTDHAAARKAMATVLRLEAERLGVDLAA